jgi:hypothetical protein
MEEHPEVGGDTAWVGYIMQWKLELPVTLNNGKYG